MQQPAIGGSMPPLCSQTSLPQAEWALCLSSPGPTGGRCVLLFKSRFLNFL